MRSAIAGVLTLFAFTPAGPLVAQGGSVAIAVLPFGDGGSYGQDKEVFRALTLGIPATLMSELSGHPSLRLAESSRILQALQKEQTPNSRIDAATAARVGKQVGARYAVTGNFADFYGKFHLDARVVDTESGQILKVVSNDDPKLQDRADLYRIIQMVAHRVLDVASPDALRSTKTESERIVIPTEAISQFSLGLLYETQGDKTRASEHYQRALTRYPDYPDAEAGMRRVRGS